MIIEVLYQDTLQKETFEVSADSCVVGRSPKANVTLNHEALSRNHFQIDLVDGDFYVTDLNSTNGIFVNGEKLLPGVRTSYKPIFPMEIGASIVITVMPESETPVSAGTKATHHRSDLSRLGEPTAKTKVNTKSQVSKSVSTAMAPKKLPEKSGLTGSALISASLVAGAVAYYVFNGDPPSGEIKRGQGHTEVKLESLKKNQVAIPPLNLQEIDPRKYMETNECPLYGTLCSAIGLTGPKEKLVYAENKLFIYVNLEAFTLEKAHADFQKLPDKERAEYIMARIGTHPILQEELVQKQPTHVLVVGITVLEEMIRLKYLLNIGYKQLPSIGQDLYDYLFSEIFHAGFTGPYKKYVGHYSQMTDL